jgi:hypothetical protein
MLSFIEELQNECTTVLSNALLNKEVFAFGVDGYGKYGKSSSAFYFTISNVNVSIDADNDDDLPPAVLTIVLDNYSCLTCGDICTDQNFQHALNNLLSSAKIKTDCWSWMPIGQQGGNYVQLWLDVRKLMNL